MNSRNPFSLESSRISHTQIIRSARGPSAEFPLIRRIRSSQRGGVTNSNQVTENNRDTVEYSRISTV